MITSRLCDAGYATLDSDLNVRGAYMHDSDPDISPDHPVSEPPLMRAAPTERAASEPSLIGCVTGTSDMSRRQLLASMSAGLSAALGTHLVQDSQPSQAHASPKSHPPQTHPILSKLDLDQFVVHGETPLTVEAKRHTIGTSVITHARHLFIRNNLPLPDARITHDPDAWSVDVAGVRDERSVTVAELKTLELHTVAAVLQCSGNGRAFYTHGPSGSKWATGAAGCVIWSGVKVSSVVEYLGGVTSGKHYLTSTGGDPLPEGVDPSSVIVERSVPLKKALDDGLLAWEMNGEPIPLEHGGPLRLVIPGYFGCNQIKYVKKVSLTAEQSRSKIQRSGYRMRSIGEKGNSTQPSMWTMPVKSWLTNPERLYGTHQMLRGVALGGERQVTRVEVSSDGGITWSPAAFVGPDLGRFAWRLFQLKVSLPPGKHTLVCRAYNDLGERQPEGRHENERGYGHQGWRDHQLTITVEESPPQALSTQLRSHSQRTHTQRQEPSINRVAPSSPRHVKLSPDAQRGREIFLKRARPPCGACHSLNDAQTAGTVGPDLDALRPTIAQVKAAVSKGLGAMPAQNNLSDQQLEDLARYIVEVTTHK